MSTFNFTEDYTERCPVGVQKSVISAMEVKDNKAGTGKLIVVDFTIVEGEFKNEQIRTWINFEHPNEQTANIGRRNLDQLCKQVGLSGLSELNDPSQLISKIVDIEYGITKGGDFDGKLLVKSFKPKKIDTALKDDDVPF